MKDDREKEAAEQALRLVRGDSLDLTTRDNDVARADH